MHRSVHRIRPPFQTASRWLLYLCRFQLFVNNKKCFQNENYIIKSTYHPEKLYTFLTLKKKSWSRLRIGGLHKNPPSSGIYYTIFILFFKTSRTLGLKAATLAPLYRHLQAEYSKETLSKISYVTWREATISTHAISAFASLEIVAFLPSLRNILFISYFFHCYY